MKYLLELRRRYGSVYATKLLDGRVIPWKPLSIGNYLEYDKLYRRGGLSWASLEDEIFTKCVLDEYVVKHLKKENAGNISLIVNNIMSVSGPISLEEMQDLLMLKRLEASGIIHSMIDVITRAYPAYTPEQAYDFNYQTLMLRYAQAENKLIEMGILLGPNSLVNPYKQETPQTEQAKYTPKGYVPQRPSSQVQKTIISKEDLNKGTDDYIDPDDNKDIIEKKMIEDSRIIYKDYIDKMKAGQPVEIKDVSQRQEEAARRMEENAIKLDIMKKAKAEEIKTQEAKMAKILESKGRKKRRR